MPDFGVNARSIQRILGEEDYDFVVYYDNDATQIKAREGNSQRTEYSHATDLGSVLGSIHGSLSSTSGGTVKIKVVVMDGVLNYQ